MIRRTSFLRSSLFGIVAGALLLTGCSGLRPRPVEDESLPASRFGSVESISVVVSKKGETLSSIAHRHTGSAANWQKIAAANPEINPKKIRVGQQILIPGTLLSRNSNSVESPLAVSKLEKRNAGVENSPKRRSEGRAALKRSVANNKGSEVAVASTEREASLPAASAATTEVLAAPAAIGVHLASVKGDSAATVSEAPKEKGSSQVSNENPPAEKPAGKSSSKRKQSLSKASRYRVIASSGYGSLNREVSHLDAELAKAEALAAQLRKQQAAHSAQAKGSKAAVKPAEADKNYFSCSHNKCSTK